ncbi:MAG: ABC transporter permease [Pseudomonadota bacterium]|nr:ABC transporter permease [Pseudomonadota bacterium]
MDFIIEILDLALALIISFDEVVFEIVWLSIKVSFTALILSCLVAVPLGIVLGVNRFFGRNFLILLFNTLMGLPPVVVGLSVYLILSRSGPLGWMNFLYTPYAMIIAQMILIIPIVTSLTCQKIEELFMEYRELFLSIRVKKSQQFWVYLLDARYALLTIFLAGFGRAISEVGAVIIVGGNIDHVTRMMTTAIAMHTSRGDLSLAIALGLILLFIALVVNLTVFVLKVMAKRFGYD